MMDAASPNAPAELKRCCAALYGSDWARLLLGESFHPGGVILTERLGGLIGLGQTSCVLDVAAGIGTSAIHLARRCGCMVTGVDLAPANVARASAAAAQAGVGDRVRFVAGDAERLPFLDGSFDAVVCECALCTFPDKATACAEMGRVVRTGGRIGIGDLTRSGPLPEALDGVLAWIACVADAQPVAGYEDLLRTAGFSVDVVERHDHALSELIDRVRVRLLGAKVLASMHDLDLPAIDQLSMRTMIQSAMEAVAHGRLGYALLVATKTG